MIEGSSEFEDEESDYTAIAACNYFNLLEKSMDDGELSETSLIDNIIEMSEKRGHLSLVKK